MTDDIVTRLHDCGNNCGCYATSFYECVCDGVEWPNGALNIEAADEIERLRAERDGWQAAWHKTFSELGEAADEIERLRAAGDALVESLDHSRADIRSAVAAWEEARRG